MRTTRAPDDEWEALVRDQQLVLLNTWKSARPAHCVTFQNGDVTSQIDFIVTRRRHADGVARQSTPIALEALQLDEAKMQKCREAGWLGEGRQALDPAWFYHGWDTKNKCQIQAPVDPRSRTTILKDLDLAIRYLSMEGILLRFKCTKTLSEDLEGEVVPFMLTISMRTQEADDLHRIFKSLAGCACCKLLGLRVKPERGQRSQLSKQLEQSYLSQDFCEWKPRWGDRARGSA